MLINQQPRLTNRPPLSKRGLVGLLPHPTNDSECRDQQDRNEITFTSGPAAITPERSAWPCVAD